MRPDTPTGQTMGRGLRWLQALALCVLVLAANAVAWRLANPPLPAPDVPARVAGLAYNAFGRWDSPLAQRLPSDEHIAADLRLLATRTQRLRTYSAAEFPTLPAQADALGLQLTLGVWLDNQPQRDEREIAAAVRAAREHRSVQRVIAGNETQLHRSLTPQALQAVLERLRRELRVPVSTAEPWHVWLARPDLAQQVDFITVHLLPYWEGVDLQGAVNEALRRLQEVRRRYPDKPVVVGEIGWPSHGAAVGGARASPDWQARFVRDFLSRPQAQGLDYYLMEAIDQPWKRATEGEAGAYWGLFHADRSPKFDFTGPVERDPWWRGKALAASLLGAVALLPLLLALSHLPWRGRLCLAACVQAVASFAVLLATLPLMNYLRGVDALMLVLLVPALGLMAAMLLAQAFEFAELRWSGALRRAATARPWPGEAAAPFVSIHLPCSNEPPAQVIATIDSLLALDWPCFEVIVVDNNTRDEARWRAVQAHVQAVNAARPAGAPALRFVHLPRWPGYKAGALNVALAESDPRAAWVAVVDADYVVDPGWLRAVGGHLLRPEVGLVQCPQAHRDWQGQRLARAMNWEYEGFFRLGMHHRNERNAIVAHGTMLLLRREAVRTAGGWRADGLCEDTELNLRLLEHGWQAVYVDEVLGRGLVPADFGAYGRQRERWARGGLQIARQHAGALFGRSRLSLSQRYHFLAGWLPWIGDALHGLFTLTALAWTALAVAAPGVFTLPIALFVVPLLVFFGARALAVPLLYRARVTPRWRATLGACVAGMALSHRAARGVLAGLFGREGRFVVTVRSGAARPGAQAGEGWRSAREEAALLAALLLAMTALPLAHAVRGDAPGAALAGWTLVLALQALPYAAAVACAVAGRSPAGAVKPGAADTASPEELQYRSAS